MDSCSAPCEWQALLADSNAQARAQLRRLQLYDPDYGRESAAAHLLPRSFPAGYKNSLLPMLSGIRAARPYPTNPMRIQWTTYRTKMSG